MKCSLNILFNVPQWWKWSVLHISCLICHNDANEVFFACHDHTIFHLNIVFCWSCRSWCERIKTVSMNLLYTCNLNSSVSRKTPVLCDVDNFGHGFEFNENGAPHQKNKSGPGPPTSLTRPWGWSQLEVVLLWRHTDVCIRHHLHNFRYQRLREIPNSRRVDANWKHRETPIHL